MLSALVIEIEKIRFRLPCFVFVCLRASALGPLSVSPTPLEVEERSHSTRASDDRHRDVRTAYKAVPSPTTPTVHRRAREVRKRRSSGPNVVLLTLELGDTVLDALSKRITEMGKVGIANTESWRVNTRSPKEMERVIPAKVYF